MILMDTSAIVAIADARDEAHERALDALNNLRSGLGLPRKSNDQRHHDRRQRQ